MNVASGWLPPLFGLAGFGLVTALPSSSPSAQGTEPMADPTPMVTIEHVDTFASGTGTIGLAKQFDNDCSMAGGLFVDPPVVLEEALHEVPAGTRVVPIARCYTHAVGGKYLGSGSWLTFRPADSSEGFEYSRVYYQPDVTGEVVIYLKNELTWGEVDHESDIGVHSAMSLR